MWSWNGGVEKSCISEYIEYVPLNFILLHPNPLPDAQRLVRLDAVLLADFVDGGAVALCDFAQGVA